MDIKLVKKESSKATIEWKLPWDEFKEYEKKAYLSERGYFKIDGFRKGKAPKHIIENYYGKGVFYEEAINKAIVDKYEDIINELDLKVVGYPKADVKELEEGKDVILELETEIFPEFEIENLEENEIPLIEEEVTDEMIEAQLEAERSKNARQILVEDRAAKLGDSVVIDFVGYMDGVPFEGGADEGAELTLGSGKFIPGFEEQIEGKNIGDEFDITVKFPENYHAKDYAGKEAVFKTVLHDIYTIELPELDDDFASEVSEFDTLKEYKEDLRKKLNENLEENKAIRDENNLVENLVKKSGIEAPSALVKEYADREFEDYKFNMKKQGIEFNDYLKYTGLKEEDIRNQLNPMAKRKAEVDLVLSQAAKQLNLEVTDEDREEAIRDAASAFGMDPDKFLEMAKDKNFGFMDQGITNKKVVTHLMEKVKRVKEEKTEKEEKKAKKTTKKADKEKADKEDKKEEKTEKKAKKTTKKSTEKKAKEDKEDKKEEK